MIRNASCTDCSISCCSERVFGKGFITVESRLIYRRGSVDLDEVGAKYHSHSIKLIVFYNPRLLNNAYLAWKRRITWTMIEL